MYHTPIDAANLIWFFEDVFNIFWSWSVYRCDSQECHLFGKAYWCEVPPDKGVDCYKRHCSWEVSYFREFRWYADEASSIRQVQALFGFG